MAVDAAEPLTFRLADPTAPQLRAGESERVAVLSSGPISYILRRTARSRHLRVTIDPARGVVVAAPPATRRGWARPERDIERFLAEREPWLRRHLARIAATRAELAARGGITDGATLRFRGELHHLRIMSGAAAARSSIAREAGDERDEI